MDKAASQPLVPVMQPLGKNMHSIRFVLTLVAVVLCYHAWHAFVSLSASHPAYPTQAAPPLHASETLRRCRSLYLSPGPPDNFYDREQSDRYVPGTKPTLIKNATIWTGNDDGTQVIKRDILIDKGIIKGVGNFGHLERSSEMEVIEVNGAWVTPGIVDIHSHLGVGSSPGLRGASDGNSRKGPILPWLRSLDGLNTHDDAYQLSIAGGVTAALVLPGSANAIGKYLNHRLQAGGQAYVIKLRKTAERSPISMVLEPPFEVDGSEPLGRPRWRHMKHACGENPSRVYSATRMDTIWAFREAYNHATIIKNKQDAYCARALRGDWTGLGHFPEDLQWEALVDVLRGKVKVNTHCYETVDLDDLVRITNEFKFPIAAFHHAHETYLVPEVLKRAYRGSLGVPPAVAIFATNARYKREAYRGSEFAPRILAENDITVLMKSDHPVLDSRYLLYEAQQAHYYGLPNNLAMASVTSNSAKVMGMDHRIGFIRKGYDADIVVWDSHPLALGATPRQVFIDGITQISSPATLEKPEAFQHTPKVPNFDEEAKEALEYEGLPPLVPESVEDVVLFTNVKSVFTRSGNHVVQTFSTQSQEKQGVVVVQSGEIICSGLWAVCVGKSHAYKGARVVNLLGGSISPGLLSFGSPLGLENIPAEASTNDGVVLDPLLVPIPKVFGNDSAAIRAVDGLQFATRDALLAYYSGVTSGVTAPVGLFYSGYSTSFSTGAAHKLEQGAVIKDVTAFHAAIRHTGVPSVSSQIAALRNSLLRGEGWASQVLEGSIPLVVDAHQADDIATLILLKQEVDSKKRSNIRLTIAGATEAHLLAKQLGEAGVGVIVNPSRPYPLTWSDRRVLPGPPLTANTTISTLLANRVSVGIGTLEKWNARNTRFDVAWAALEAGIGKEDALAIGSANLERMLGAESEADLVATRNGDLLEISSKVVAVISPRSGKVNLLRYEGW